MADLRTLKHIYGEALVDDVLDLQRAIYERGLRGVRFSETARQYAARNGDEHVARQISEELQRL
jgi:hypothetical protein